MLLCIVTCGYIYGADMSLGDMYNFIVNILHIVLIIIYDPD